MSLSDLLTLIGVLVAVGLAAIGIYLAVRNLPKDEIWKRAGVAALAIGLVLVIVIVYRIATGAGVGGQSTAGTGPANGGSPQSTANPSTFTSSPTSISAPSPTPLPTATHTPAPLPTQILPPPFYTETAGPADSDTFTDYISADGKNVHISGYQSIQVSCRLTGWSPPDGDNWWYRIVSSPWNNQFYAPADNFYNNGQTQGPFSDVFVDNQVPFC